MSDAVVKLRYLVMLAKREGSWWVQMLAPDAAAALDKCDALISEVDQLRAEVDRMRPVYEAAIAWRKAVFRTEQLETAIDAATDKIGRNHSDGAKP